jgi:hypothetical protein
MGVGHGLVAACCCVACAVYYTAFMLQINQVQNSRDPRPPCGVSFLITDKPSLYRSLRTRTLSLPSLSLHPSRCPSKHGDGRSFPAYIDVCIYRFPAYIIIYRKGEGVLGLASMFLFCFSMFLFYFSTKLAPSPLQTSRPRHSTREEGARRC